MNRFELLKTFFIKNGVPKSSELEAFVSLWDVVNLGRNEVMTSEGQVERYMYFVVEGIQKSVYLNNGKEHVVAFTYPNNFSGVPDSFLMETPAKCTLTTISKSILLRIGREAFFHALETYRPLELFYFSSMKVVLVGTIERLYELQAFSMEEKFNVFYQRSKHLINQIPRKDIASYLSIDPTNLSKLLSGLKQ